MRSYLFFFGFAFILLSFSPFSAFPIKNDPKALLAKMENNRESTKKIIEMHLNRLNSCKNKCMNLPCSMGYCGEGKGSVQCEAMECSEHKRLYEQYKTELAKIEKQIADLKSSMANNNRQAGNRGQTQNTGNTAKQTGQNQDIENVIQKVDRGKKDAKIQRLLGVGVTAGLAYKAYTCCKKPVPVASYKIMGSSPPTAVPPDCPGCPYWWMATIAAGVMTLSIKDQEKKFERTQKDLCAAEPNAVGCSDNKPKGAPEPFPPSCYQPGVNCEKINEIIQGFDTTSKPCPPEDTSCSKQAPGLIPPNFDEVKFGEQGLEAYKSGLMPKGASPEMIANSRKFSYNNMPPEMKKEFDNYMGNINKMNKNYAKMAGSSLDTDNKAGLARDDLDEETEGVSTGGGLGSSVGAGAFSGGKSKSTVHPSGSGKTTGAGKKKSSLAEQINKMLSSLYNNPDAEDPYAHRSTEFGSDSVGVKEDNIFMMIHRRHRALDSQNNFLRDEL